MNGHNQQFATSQPRHCVSLFDIWYRSSHQLQHPPPSQDVCQLYLLFFYSLFVCFLPLQRSNSPSRWMPCHPIPLSLPMFILLLLLVSPLPLPLSLSKVLQRELEALASTLVIRPVQPKSWPLFQAIDLVWRVPAVMLFLVFMGK